MKTEHGIRMRDLLSEAKRDNEFAIGAPVLAFVLASLLQVNVRAVRNIPMSISMSQTLTLLLGTEKKLHL